MFGGSGEIGDVAVGGSGNAPGVWRVVSSGEVAFEVVGVGDGGAGEVFFPEIFGCFDGAAGAAGSGGAGMVSGVENGGNREA